MRKKILTLMCVGLMAISLVGCNKDKDDSNDRDTTETTEFSLPGFDNQDIDTENETEEPSSEQITTRIFSDTCYNSNLRNCKLIHRFTKIQF